MSNRLFEKTEDVNFSTLDTSLKLAYGKASTSPKNVSHLNYFGIIRAVFKGTGSLFASVFLDSANNLSEVSSKAISKKNIEAANLFTVESIDNRAGGSSNSPVMLNIIDPTTVDIINLNSATGGWYDMPTPTVFPSLVSGTMIVIRCSGSVDNTKIIKDTNLEKHGSGVIIILRYGAVTLRWNGTSWCMISASTYPLAKFE